MSLERRKAEKSRECTHRGMAKVYDMMFNNCLAVMLEIEAVDPQTKQVDFTLLYYGPKKDDVGKEVWIETSGMHMTLLRATVDMDVLMAELGTSLPLQPASLHVVPKDGAEKTKAAVGEAVAKTIDAWAPLPTRIVGEFGYDLLASASSLEELMVMSDLQSS